MEFPETFFLLSLSCCYFSQIFTSLMLGKISVDLQDFVNGSQDFMLKSFLQFYSVKKELIEWKKYFKPSRHSNHIPPIFSISIQPKLANQLLELNKYEVEWIGLRAGNPLKKKLFCNWTFCYVWDLVCLLFTEIFLKTEI